MSLSAWEQQALESIKNGLSGSDPELTALLSAFNRLASGEEMPERENIQARSRRALRRLCRARRRTSLKQPGQRPRFQRTFLLLWLLTTAAMIAIALVLSTGDQGTCTETVAMVCVPTPGHSPHEPSVTRIRASLPRASQAGPITSAPSPVRSA
jgi:hypothetical protein